jgi:hypothetical protein
VGPRTAPSPTSYQATASRSCAANERPRVAGFVRISELLNAPKDDRLFPEWHPRAGEPGAPQLYIFDVPGTLELREQLQDAPLEEDGKPHPGEAVDRDWERKKGHAHASLRYGVTKGMAVADAGAHIEKAIVKFGDDDQLLQVQADLHEAVQSGAETWTTDVQAEPKTEPEMVEPTEAEKDAADHDAAVEEINAAETVEDAVEKIVAALERWPASDVLAALKQRADEMIAAKPGDVDEIPQPPAPLEEMKLHELREYAAKVGVDAATLATFEPANTPKADVRAAITARLEARAQA